MFCRWSDPFVKVISRYSANKIRISLQPLCISVFWNHKMSIRGELMVNDVLFCFFNEKMHEGNKEREPETNNNRELKQLRRRPHNNFKKHNRFNDQNNSSARAWRFLVHFFDVHYAISTWNLLIWRFMEDVDMREPEENPSEFNSRKSRLHLTYWAGPNRRD